MNTTRMCNLLYVALAMVMAIAFSAGQALSATIIDLQMDEGTGTSVGDSGGYGNNGYFEDLPAGDDSMGWVAGHNGSGVKMKRMAGPDNDDDIRVPTSWNLNITGAFHSSMWVNPTGSGTWNPVGDPNAGGGTIEFLVSADWGWSKGQAYGVYVPANALPHGVLAFVNNGTKDFSGGGALLTERLVAGAWNQIEMAFDGSQTYDLWVNGVNVSHNVLPSPESIVLKPTSDLYIGTNKWTNGYLTGVVDEFEITGTPGVPEPGSLLALGTGIMSLAGLALRRRTR